MENPLITMATFGNARKRGREEDEAEDFANGRPSGFGEHRQKRRQSEQKRWSDPSVIPLNATQMRPETITPAASDSDDREQRNWSWAPPASLNGIAPGVPHHSEMDTEMDISSPSREQSGLEPGSFHEEPVAHTIAGRIPTPIQPSFGSQVRGVPWNGPGQSTNPGQMNGVQNLGHQHGGFDSNDAIPRSMDSNAEWKALRDRRLPSPISEGEDGFSPMSGGEASPPCHVLDGGFTNQLAARLASSISISTPGDEMMPQRPQPQQEDYQRHERDLDHIRAELMKAAQLSPEANSAPATPSPGKKGHVRSRHTINSWTWQPGMKKSFSIGYRADCEKCRLKVPGHFNHIIVS